MIIIDICGRKTSALVNDLIIYRNYREDCLRYFKKPIEAQKFDKYITAIETELTRRGVEFK